MAGLFREIQNYQGTWLGGFAWNIDRINSLAAELWALQDGFVLSQNLNIWRLIIEINAKVVIDLLSSMCESVLSMHTYYALICDCRSLIQTFEETLL